MTEIPATNVQLLKISEVQKITKMSVSNIYRLMALGEFPKPIRVGTAAKRWIDFEIKNHIEQRMAAR